MQVNKNYANELTVGINFFENVPPVRIQKDLSQWKRSTEAPYMESKQTKQKNTKAHDVAKKTVVKGFGGTALFTAGLLITSEQAGDHIRLDDGLKKHNRLHNSEDICKRNPTIVRKYYNEKDIEAENNICRIKEDEELHMPSDFREDILASDYHTKSGNLKKILGVAIQ
jgi:hypothetical protein